MSKVFANLVILGIILAAQSHGQGLPDQLNFSRSNVEGPHLYGISANSSYSTYDFSSSAGTPSTQRSRTNYGISATAGWLRTHGRTSFSMRYTGGYNGDVHYSNLNSLHHSLVLNLSRSLGRKWTFELSGSGQESDLSQSIFEPTNLAALTQSGALFDDLAASQSVGQYTSVQNGLILGGGVSPSATRALLLGNRILTYNVTATFTYAYSTRLRFSIGSFAMGGQHRSGDTAGVAENYVLPRTLGGTASASMYYDLSPRTDVEVGVSQNYVNTRYQKSTATSSTVGLGRKMGRNWFLRGNGGVFISEKNQQSVGTPPLRQATWGGSIGFRTHSHSLVANYMRTGQEIGVAAAVGKNTVLSGSWSWSPVRRAWSVHANYSRYETSSTGFLAITGWQVGAGLNRSLGWNLSLMLNYAYLISSSDFLTLTNRVNVNSARLSLGWTPHLRRASRGVQETDTDQ